MTNYVESMLAIIETILAHLRSFNNSLTNEESNQLSQLINKYHIVKKMALNCEVLIDQAYENQIHYTTKENATKYNFTNKDYALCCDAYDNYFNEYQKFKTDLNNTSPAAYNEFSPYKKELELTFASLFKKMNAKYEGLRYFKWYPYHNSKHGKFFNYENYSPKNQHGEINTNYDTEFEQEIARQNKKFV